jgi:lysophospholipase L1-like esterase
MHAPRKLALLLAPVLAAGLLAGRCPADEPKANSAVKPVPRDKGWLARHKKFVEIAKRGGVDVLFLGDSITDAWGGEGHNPDSPGAKIFEKEFVPLKAANFGIGGDRTQHVLWRLRHGELEGIQPRVVMLMIGTNNSNGKDNTAAEIAEGVTAIVKEIHKRSPRTRVLLLGIFPRATAGLAENKAQMDKIRAVNRAIAKLDDGGKTVKYLDIGEKFLASDGTIPREIMPDRLHLSAKGYRIWADAVKGPIKELLGKE